MSDDEEPYNPKAHQKLLQAINNLGSAQSIGKYTRDERQQQQNEFQLVKTHKGVDQSSKGVGFNDLVQILRTSKHIETGKKLKNVYSTKKVLQKPLEKPVADRIKRTIGYEGVKKKLGRWDAVVAKQRSAETQIFPIPTETIYVNTAAHAHALKTSIKSDLGKELEASNQKLRELRKARIGDTTDEKQLVQQEKELLQKKMTRDEMLARRRELAYIRMRASQKSAKARMQNKIKSKKYHKLQKRQKILEQMKEFEVLQKTNPEAALEKLNALEKSRVLERASLRHKNTGTWAKNLQVRAKYDKDVRKDLAEQLAVSRQLTEKQLDTDSEDEQTAIKLKEIDQEDNDPFNPWTKLKNAPKLQAQENGDNTNWRKYWIERNSNEKLVAEHYAELDAAVLEKKINNENIEKKKKIKPVKKKKSKVRVENGWVVEKISNSSDKACSLDDIFEKHQEKIRERLSKKLEKLKKITKDQNQSIQKEKKAKKKPNELKNLEDLTFKNKKQRVEIDEPLNNDLIPQLIDEVSNTKAMLQTNECTTSSIIDPNKVTTITWKQSMRSTDALNDALGEDEDVELADVDAAAEHQLTISQAFEDDDIVADFNKDKSKDSEVKNSDLQLAMPGWGSWAGAGMSEELIHRRNQRLLLKLAAPEQRRDDNKDNLYINETTSKQARAHMVSSIPFPFKSLADYEASIRAPIGRNFVPETAFRMLTRPSVITRKGQVIEPMDESELVKPDRKLRHVVDRRIKRLQAAQKAKIA